MVCEPVKRPVTRRFRRDEAGGSSILFALTIFALLGAAALAVDSATFYVTKRRLQSATDLAAIAAAADTANSTAAAAATLAANGFPGSLVSAIPGTYAADPTRAAGQRFTAGGSAPNAALVTARTTSPMIFGRVFGSAQARTSTAPVDASAPAAAGSVAIGASAVAARSAVASFAIGSRLASLNGGIANAVLSALTGSSISLSAVDYNALLSTNIDMLSYARALNTTLGLKAGTYSDVLEASIAPADALRVLAAMNGVGGGAYGALSSLRTALAAAPGAVKLGQIVDFGPYDGKAIAYVPPLNVTMRAFEVAAATAELASGGHQGVVDLGTGVPGLADVKLSLVVGQRPVSATVQQIGAGPGMPVTTAQIRASITASVTVAGLTTLNVPIVLDLAKASAQVTSLACQSGQVSTASLTLAVTPAVADAYIGTAATAIPVPPAALPALQAAPIATVAGLTVFASAHAAITNVAPTPVSFSYSDVAAGTIRTVSTVNPIETLVASLLGNTQIALAAGGSSLGLPLGAPVLAQTVGTALTAASPAIDQLLVSLTAALGVGIGQADTWVTDLRCGSAVLVN